MPNYLWAFLIAAVAAVVLTPFVIRLAFRTGALDAPDARKVHKKPIPRIGGLAIYGAFMISMLLLLETSEIPEEMAQGVIGLFVGGSLIVALGLWDDYVSLPPKVKLFGQIVCAWAAVAFGVRIDFITSFSGEIMYLYDYVTIPLTIFWMVGVTNTVNLIDGLDGLAAGVAAIASLTICLVALRMDILVVAVLTAALGGAAFGFLFYNFNPAKIFMGDTGSMFLGFMLSGISIVGVMKSAAMVALVVPVLALGLPIMDTTFAIVRRWMAGAPIMKPDKGHLHHRLLNLGFSQRQAVLLMYVISAVLGSAAIVMTAVSPRAAILILIMMVVAVLYGAKRLGIFKLKATR
ncbi:MAG: undecaprenyl/decaprenyl-phosphate alpha-N-acetylglucosaminyl 1-phosphate transferase [Schwartzia sp.]|nr:undecaprenyl/decaprenyl-phosphate alpha-N-acetylglucosaminyl 1-phosphate transferase [Schwartzia sp. (in: firmicutes)]MBR1886297.1 undecaprenyl/decaprenyl-phosphate alpha-N-acetylglucosaminyl 1-phosphate transferase [Schwartzia sp. (in: firmicutes)]